LRVVVFLGRIVCRQCIDRPIATDVARGVVCVSVLVLGTRMSCAKTAEQIEMPRGLTHVGPRNCIVLDGSTHPPTEGGTLLRGYVPAHCNVPTHGECACPNARGRRMYWPPRQVTRRRCGLLPNNFGHLLFIVTPHQHTRIHKNIETIIL